MFCLILVHNVLFWFFYDKFSFFFCIIVCGAMFLLHTHSIYKICTIYYLFYIKIYLSILDICIGYCYLWYSKVTLPLVCDICSLPLMVFVAIVVVPKDLPLHQYSMMVLNVEIYFHKKDTHIFQWGSFWQKIYCLFWIPYGYLGKCKLHYTQGVDL